MITKLFLSMIFIIFAYLLKTRFINCDIMFYVIEHRTKRKEVHFDWIS